MSTRVRPNSTSCFHLLLPLCSLPRPPGDATHLPGATSTSPSVPIPLCSLSLPRPNGARRRRPALARPQPSRSLSDTPPSSAVPPSSSPSAHMAGRAPTRRPRPVLNHRPPRISIVDSSPSELPRTRRGHHCTPRELLIILPLSVLSLACRSRRASLTRQHAAARARRRRGSGGHLVPCVPTLGS